MNTIKKNVLVTGSTAGIGRAIAIKFAQNGYNVVITGRRQKKLDALADHLRNDYGANVLPLCFDVRSYDAVYESLSQLKEEWLNIDVLVNNAGLALGLNPIHEGVVDDWEQMINTNIKGLLYVTRLISPRMVSRKSGHIVNISSIAGKEVYRNGNVYCATKHAVSALTQAIRMDLLNFGIKVTQVCPGAVETEFSKVRFKGDEKQASMVYEGFDPLVAKDVADAVYYAASAPPHVDVQDLLIMPTAQASATSFDKK